MSDDGHASPPAMRVWDLPTRLFHWSLVVLFVILWWSGKNERVELHVAAGLTMMGLLLFRLIWGFVGGSTARFARFVRGPGAVLAYLRGRAGPLHGHNPLSGWSVVVLLLLLLVQVGLGLFASDEDGFDSGPLSDLVSFATAQRLLENHETLFNILLGLVALHLAAIVAYLLRGQELVSPMITGRGDPDRGGEPLRPAPLWRFVLAVLLAASLPLWIAWR